MLSSLRLRRWLWLGCAVYKKSVACTCCVLATAAAATAAAMASARVRVRARARARARARGASAMFGERKVPSSRQASLPCRVVCSAAHVEVVGGGPENHGVGVSGHQEAVSNSWAEAGLYIPQMDIHCGVAQGTYMARKGARKGPGEVESWYKRPVGPRTAQRRRGAKR